MLKPFSKKRKKLTKKNRGALTTIALIFALSALIRLSGGAGEAIADEISAFKNVETQEMENQSSTIYSDVEIAALMDGLKKRENALISKEMEIAKKMKAIELASAEISANLTALKAAENSLKSTMALSASAAEDDLLQLTAVYETMKPKDAAALFEAMTPEFAAGFLSRMNSNSAAALMAGLEPETAYTISVILAGRNANAPRK